MLVGVDETGSFKNKSGKEFGLVTLVSITDAEWRSFQDFMNTRFPGAFGTIKGSNISFQDRVTIIKYIGRHPEIKYTTFLYQINPYESGIVENHKLQQVERIQNWIIRNLTTAAPTLITDMEKLRNWVGNLSETDYAKFSFVINGIIEWEKYFQFDYMRTHLSRDRWEMEHVIDTQNKAEKFRTLVKWTLQLTANEHTPDFRTYTPEEWGQKHPLVVNHAVDGDTTRINGHKFYQNLKVGSEQENPVLFIPDLIGNTIYNSIQNLQDNKWSRILARMKQNRSLVITKGDGSNLFYIVSGFSGSENPTRVDEHFRRHIDMMSAY